MPEYDEDGNEITPDPNSGSELRRKLEEALEQNRQLQETAVQAAEAQKELAFIRAGLQGDPRAVNFFKQHYDGPLDEEAIRAAAQEAGVQPEMAPQAQQAAQAQQQMSMVAQGAAEPMAPGSQEEMWQEFEKAVSSGAADAMQRGEAVLRRFGHDMTGIENRQMSPSGTNPVPVPMSDPNWRGTPMPGE